MSLHNACGNLKNALISSILLTTKNSATTSLVNCLRTTSSRRLLLISKLSVHSPINQKTNTKAAPTEINAA